MSSTLIKVDPKLNLPLAYNLVRIFYRQGEGEGWGLCWSLGYWDGSYWYRLEHQPASLDKARFSGVMQRRVEGWSEILHDLSADQALELRITT